MPHMLAEGLLCKEYISGIVMEFHDWARSAGWEHWVWPDNFTEQVLQQRRCKLGPTEIVDLDDETFLHDGKSLPSV